ncbi:MAG TPA: hypothetical protein VI685_12965 [Candidatus Angelobacter sp.]
MELQTEAEFIEVKSPIDRFREQWNAETGTGGFFRQRTFILKHPELVQYAELAGAKGWSQPLAFALKGLLLAALVISAFSWLVTRNGGKYADWIASVRTELESEMKTERAVIDAAQLQMGRIENSRKLAGFTVATSTNLTKEEAMKQLDAMIDQAHKLQEEYKYRAAVKTQNLRAEADSAALAASGTAIMVSLALLFAAPFFRRFIQQPYGRYRLINQADSFYLYYVASQGFLLNLGLVLILNLALSNSAYGLNGLVKGVGPLGRGLFFLALYAGLLYWFYVVSKDLYKAMLLPRPGDYKNLENKVLLWMHNSFWMVFAAFETTLGALAYGVYLLERAK